MNKDQAGPENEEDDPVDGEEDEGSDTDVVAEAPPKKAKAKAKTAKSAKADPKTAKGKTVKANAAATKAKAAIAKAKAKAATTKAAKKAAPAADDATRRGRQPSEETQEARKILMRLAKRKDGVTNIDLAGELETTTLKTSSLARPLVLSGAITAEKGENGRVTYRVAA